MSGLVHLNGRVYDPLLARFTSPDTMTESPFSTQGWNRYSYVGNDPLRFTDPSGHCFLGCFWQPIVHAVTHFFATNPIARAILQIAATVVLNAVLPGLGFAGVALAAASAAGGAAIATGLSGGNLGQILKSAAIAGLTAAAFFEVGEATNEIAGYNPTGDMPVHLQTGLDTPGAYAFNVAGHALVGCASSAASAGSCQSGALSAGISAAAGPWINGGNQAASLVRNAVVGGLASVAGGGKFANGAITGAFGYLFNNAAGALRGASIGGWTGGAVFAVAGAEMGPADLAVAGLGRWLGATLGAMIGDWATGPDVVYSEGNKLPDDRIIAPPGQRGLAPIGDDGYPVELHHRDQDPDGPLDEMTRTDHRLGGNFSNNHDNTGQSPSSIDRTVFNTERRAYWAQEWDSGRFSK